MRQLIDKVDIAMRALNIGGQEIAVATRQQLALSMVYQWQRNHERGSSNCPLLMFSANAQSNFLSSKDTRFREVMNLADLLYAETAPIVLLSRVLFPFTLSERTARTALFHEIARCAQSKGMSFFLLGGSEQVSLNAWCNITKMYPKLKMIGRRNGYFDLDQEKEIVKEISFLKPDILWVGLGTPEQEFFCARNQNRLTGITWIKTCGELFYYLAKQDKCAPMWMENINLAWMYKMICGRRQSAWQHVSATARTTAYFVRQSGKSNFVNLCT